MHGEGDLFMPFEIYNVAKCVVLVEPLVLDFVCLLRLRNREERLAPRRPGAQLLPRTGTHDATQVITTS